MTAPARATVTGPVRSAPPRVDLTHGVLALTCADRPGIVQAVASFLLQHGLDIVEHHHPRTLTTVGQDAECLALSRAVRWPCEHRVLLHGSSTVVFR